MKAYKAYEVGGDYATIVFAESAGEAKRIAQTTDACEGCDWVDIRVRREPMADSLYTGSAEIDWYNQDTRKVLVKDMGWSCFEPSWECDTCEAKEFCQWHQE